MSNLEDASLEELREMRRALGQDVEASERSLLKLLHAKLNDQVIAVLPFETVNANGECNGPVLDMADSISTNLSKNRQLIVRSMPAVLKMSRSQPDPLFIGRGLEADFVVNGEVLREGERISATAQLINVHDGTKLLEAKCSGNFQEISHVENLLSERVLQRLNLQLTKAELERLTKEHARNPDAYRNYKLGRFYLNHFPREPLDKAIECFMAAKTLEPTFARAYSGLADAFTAKGIYNIAPPGESFKQALEYAKKALEIDPSLAEAHTSLGYAYMCYERNWVKAEKEFRLALELNPNYALARQGLAHLLGAMGRFPEALREIDRALKIDPTSPLINTVRGFILYYAGHYGKALVHLRNAVNINKRFDALYHVLALVCEQIALANLRRGDFAAAQAMFEEAERASYKAIKYSGNALQKVASQAHTHALRGDKEKALQELRQLHELSTKEYLSSFFIATVYAALGMFEEALEHLERAFENRDQWIILLNVDPRFEMLRRDKASRERFEDLIRRLNFR